VLSILTTPLFAHQKGPALIALLLILIYAHPLVAQSVSDKSVVFDVKSTISLSTISRTQAANAALIDSNNGGSRQAAINSDDGNLNFEKGLISGRISLKHDSTVRYRNHGGVLKLSYFYDPILNRNKNLSSQSRADLSRQFSVKEAFLYSSLSRHNKNLDISIGNQIINWSESNFYPQPLKNINPMNFDQLRDLSNTYTDALITLPMLRIFNQLHANLSIEGFYSLKFKKSVLDPKGSYFSHNDVLSPNAEYLVSGFGFANETGTIQGTPIPTGFFYIPRIADKSVSNSHEFGAAFRWTIESLNHSEISLYVLQLNSRMPILSFIAGNGAPNSASYFAEYPEKIRNIAISINTTNQNGDMAFHGEFSYSNNTPFQIETTELAMAANQIKTTDDNVASQLGLFSPGETINGFRTFKVSRLLLSLTKLMPYHKLIRANSWRFTTELSVMRIHDLSHPQELRFEAPGTLLPARNDISINTGNGPLPVPSQVSGIADDFSWGYRAMTQANYPVSSIGGSVSPRFIFYHDVKGTSPEPGADLVEGRKKAVVEMIVDYNKSLEFKLSYTKYFGAPNRNMLADRDYLSFNAKYPF